MITQKVEVEVCLEPDPKDPSGFRLLHVRVGTEPTVPLPKDQPAPRRLVRNLIEAAKKAGATPTPKQDTPRTALHEAQTAVVSPMDAPPGPMLTHHDATPQNVAMTPGATPPKKIVP